VEEEVAHLLDVAEGHHMGAVVAHRPDTRPTEAEAGRVRVQVEVVGCHQTWDNREVQILIVSQVPRGRMSLSKSTVSLPGSLS